MTGDTHADDEATARDRRQFLRLVGAGGLVGTTGLAGCVGVGGDGGGTTDGGGGGGDDDDDSDSDDSEGGESTTESGPSSIVLGQPASLTGKWDFLQPAVSQSTDLALREINEAGGPLGADLEVSRRDTAVEPQQARNVTRQLIENDDARALVGLFSSEITPMWDFLQEQETPVITPWPGATSLDTRGGDNGTPDDVSDDGWVWRTVIGDTVHTLGAARFVLDEGIDRVGIINGTSQGERSWADSFQQAYENNGGTVSNRVEVSEGKSSYQSELDRLFEADFDAWAMALGLEDAVTVVRNWSNANYGRQLLMEDGLRDPDLIEAVGERAEGAWIAAGSSRGPNYDAFVEKFEDAGDADVHVWGVAAYDATNVAALAIHSAGSADPAEIQKHVGRVGREGGTQVSTFAEGKEALDNGEEIDYQGAATPDDFTRFGNVLGNVAVDRVTPDGFENVSTVNADDLKGLIEDY